MKTNQLFFPPFGIYIIKNKKYRDFGQTPYVVCCFKDNKIWRTSSTVEGAWLNYKRNKMTPVSVDKIIHIYEFTLVEKKSK
jgi:hypothetical protein